MGQYDALRDKVVALLKAKGHLMNILRYPNGAAPDATKPWRVAATSAQVVPVYGAIFGFGISRFTQPGDQAKKAIIQPRLPIEPQVINDLLQDGTDLWTIENVDKVDPDGTGAIVYVMKVNQWPVKI